MDYKPVGFLMLSKPDRKLAKTAKVTVVEEPFMCNYFKAELEDSEGFGATPATAIKACIAEHKRTKRQKARYNKNLRTLTRFLKRQEMIS